MHRPSKHEYCLDTVLAVARRSTCLRSACGAVIVLDDCIDEDEEQAEKGTISGLRAFLIDTAWDKGKHLSLKTDHLEESGEDESGSERAEGAETQDARGKHTLSVG